VTKQTALTDVKTLRSRARKHLEEGAVTAGYYATHSVTHPVPTAPAGASSASRISGRGSWKHRCVRNVRDCGLFERREAAQYFPEPRPPDV
jgi:hypothetical protein